MLFVDPADMRDVTETPSELLDCLVRFHEDRIGWARRIGEMLDQDQSNFLEDAGRVLCQTALPTESEKVLLVLLIEKGHVLQVLQVVYGFDRSQFRDLLSIVHGLEPKLHTRITKRLTELLARDCLQHIEEVLFLFDSLVQMNGMVNLAGVLPLLKDTKEPRLRARVALLSASMPNGRHLLELYRAEADPRVRANIVESLWLEDQPIARVTFEEARRDLQPRVRACGLLGLYRLGDSRALLALKEMAESPQSMCRAVSRNAMELLHDPRFEPLLEKLRAEFANSPFKPAAVSPAVRYGTRLILLTVPRIQKLPSGKLRVQLSARLDGVEHLDPPLRALDLRTWVDGEPVLTYAVTRVVPARRLGIGAILPMSLRATSNATPGIQSVLDLLMSMPDGELRSAGFYRSGLFMRQAGQDGAGRPFSTDDAGSAAIRLPVVSQDGFRFAADLKDASKEDNLAADPAELVLGMLNRLKVQKPVAHIGVILNEAIKDPPQASTIERLKQGCEESGCAIHVLVLGRVSSEILTPWHDISRDSGGFQNRVATEDDLPAIMNRWIFSIRESYVLEFDAPESASTIRLQAIHQCGVGEITVPIEAGADPECIAEA